MEIRVAGSMGDRRRFDPPSPTSRAGARSTASRAGSTRSESRPFAVALPTGTSRDTVWPEVISKPRTDPAGPGHLDDDVRGDPVLNGHRSVACATGASWRLRLEPLEQSSNVDMMRSASLKDHAASEV